MKTTPILTAGTPRKLSSFKYAPLTTGLVFCVFLEATAGETQTSADTPPASSSSISPTPDIDTAGSSSRQAAKKTSSTAPVNVAQVGADTNSGSAEAAVSASAPPETAVEDEPIGLESLEKITVEGRANDLSGIATSASQGEVSNNDFKYRPLSRTGELIEVVPGMIATQHSGTGKANQYFLRGFNLDHGTDFTTWVDGIPMNLRSNAHGQGYMDLNSLIPELVDKIEFGKGPYYADQGDFASTGFSRMTTKSKLSGFNNDSDKGIAKFEGGSFDYYRALFANSNHVGYGDLLYAGEFVGFNGPWTVPENGNKYNGMLKYSFGENDWNISFNGKAYYSHWTATNQIPFSSLGSSLNPTCCNVSGDTGVGSDGRFGSMNPSDAGLSNRYSASINAWHRGENTKSELNLYTLYYDLSLFSDFTYYQLNPYQGDQMHQLEQRWQSGGNVEQTWYHTLSGFDMENKVGAQLRVDNIRNLGFQNTFNQQPVSDQSMNSYYPPAFYNVNESSLWLYAQNETRWTSKIRSQLSGRSDTFWFNVQSITPGFQYNAQNSGNTSATVLSPKFNLIFGPWEETEVFINSGYGYHSNDARGVVQNYNPDGTAATPVTPLSWSRGAEIGARTQYIPGLNTTLAVWYLQTSSELVFSGDTGTTNVMGGANRYGVEWTNYYKPVSWLTLDADFAFTSARFQSIQDGSSQCTAGAVTTIVNGCGNGYDVPNAVGRVISAGAQLDLPEGYFASMRLRSFGQDALNYNGTAWMGNTNIVNLGGGWHNEQVKLELDILNLFNANANDIAYWSQYGLCNTFSGNGQCNGNVTQYNGVTFHPIMPQMVRAGITINF
jgi:hypothetical protein